MGFFRQPKRRRPRRKIRLGTGLPLVDKFLRDGDRDRKAEHRTLGVAADGGVDADESRPQIEQGSARVAVVQWGFRLNFVIAQAPKQCQW
jgi:hypothetical protein